MDKEHLDEMMSWYDFKKNSADDTFDFLMFMASQYEKLTNSASQIYD